jgi:hypothetical protein
MVGLNAKVDSISEHPSFEGASRSQQERLFHIEFRLQFFGALNRTDIVEQFGIKEAAASRDIALYKQLAPNNVEYDSKAKKYIKLDTFQPIFYVSARQAILMLQSCFEDKIICSSSPLILSEAAVELNYPKLDVLRAVTQAIFQRRSLSVRYYSLSSGVSVREIVPFALADGGLRWHVRAFDRKNKRFSDFVLNRIESPELQGVVSKVEEMKDADIQWNRIVEMHIAPHPSLEFPEAISREYGIDSEYLTVQVRAALAGYVLRHWNVDCSKKHALVSPEVHLWLKNTQALYGVDNLVLAPGYEAEE